MKPILTLIALALLTFGASPAFAAFDGAYTLDNWMLTTPGDGSVSPNTGDAAAITLTGPTAFTGYADFVVEIAADGILQFDWVYSTLDQPTFDAAGYSLDGVRTELAQIPTVLPATVSISVLAGQTFGFYAESFDGLGDPGVLDISNFSAPVPVPAPAAFLLLASALFATGLMSKR